MVLMESCLLEMDEDGYPTEETLAAIRAWAPSDFGLLRAICEIWYYPNFIVEEQDGSWAISTGGWSGNEDLIAAMQENEMWWTLHWQEIRRGGHYKFKPIYSEEK